MFSYRRRLITLAGLATLIAGTAIFSQRLNHFSKAESSADALQKTVAARHRHASQTASLRTANSLPQAPDGAKSSRREFTVYRSDTGEIVCREATAQEIRDREQADLQKPGLRQINHLELNQAREAQIPETTNLIIILRATQQLQQNAAATQAFNQAAQNWENVIMSPVTIYIDVDFGPTNFGQAWPPNILGATRVPSSSYPYPAVRANLIAEANGEGNATKQAIFNSLPATTVPTDLGDAGAVDVSDSLARAIGLLPATAQSTDTAPRIAFNSNNTFDFDPSDGITVNTIDFDAVATHEIGHALGFDSDAGENFPKPSVWDLYRFRSGTTTSTFATAQRILTIGGSPDPLQYDFIPGNPELGLSTGGPTGSSANGGDGWQSSHWKHVLTCGGTIGIMDPAIPDGCRRTITPNDVLALGSFGYNLTNSAPPPPPPPAPTPPPNDNFANAQAISGCSGSVSGSTFGATAETGEPSHDPPDSTSLSPSHTIWYQWQAPSSGSTTITTSGSDFDTILAVYTGSSVSSLTQVKFNDDVQDGVIRTSTVSFSAIGGTTYSIAVDGWGGDAGTVKLNWTGCVAQPPPGSIVISQIYGGGGTPGAIYQNSYLELFNRTSATIDVGQWTLRFTDTNGGPIASLPLPNSPYLIQAGQHLLIRLGSAGTNGSAVPVAPDIQVPSVNIGTAGQIALALPGTSLSGTCPLPNSSVVDFVGFGASPACYEGGGPSAIQGNTTAALRNSNGCIDTDNNNNDFSVGPPNPRSRQSTFTPCSGPTPTPTPTPTTTPTPSPTPTPTPATCPTALNVNDAGDAPDAAPGDGVCATSGGVCTLRAAIQEANARASCGTIDINLSGVNGSITLGTALPDINHNVAINGPGANQLTVRRSASAPQFRIFQVQTGSANISATISGLTASGGMFANGNGNLAGGIYNAGSLILNNVTVSGNASGGIWNNRGTLTLINSSVINNSSFGINTNGTLTLTNSAVSGNTGSGISNNDKLVITNSTISGNSAPQGGGIWSDSSSTSTLTNSTLSGNSSHSFGGAVYHMRGMLTLTNVTIANNRADADNVGTGVGGGIFQDTASSIAPTDRVNLKNTIVTGNWRGNGATSDDINGPVMTTSSFSLIGDGTGATGITNGAAGNQVGTGAVPIKGLIGPLTYNGGPTMTHALLVGSPAINAGSNALALDQNNNPLTTDQRGAGFPRTFNGTVDIGAYEAGNPIDEASFFVKQQYLDFLNRQPDQSGWDFWTNQITSCGSDAQCIQVRRVNTSGAFFLSIEFQQTGNLVYKMYKAGFGNLQNKPVAVDRAPFMADTRQIQSIPAQVIVGQGNWQAQLEANKQAFALAFVQRANFQALHAAAQPPDSYVNDLFSKSGAVPTAAETSAAINAFNAAGGGDAGRAAALRSVAESNSVSTKLFNEAFVLMQYFGYLQRNPYDPPEPTLDYQGYNFWLNKLNQFNGDFNAAEMVKAFISSSEYRQRFGP